MVRKYDISRWKLWSNFKAEENTVAISSDWPGVDLRVCPWLPIVPILSSWIIPELFSLSLFRVFLVKASEWEEAFFWPLAVSGLCCGTLRRIRLNRRGQPEAKRASVNYICIKGLKIPPLGEGEKVGCWGGVYELQGRDDVPLLLGGKKF